MSPTVRCVGLAGGHGWQEGNRPEGGLVPGSLVRVTRVALIIAAAWTQYAPDNSTIVKEVVTEMKKETLCGVPTEAPTSDCGR